MSILLAVPNDGGMYPDGMRQRGERAGLGAGGKRQKQPMDLPPEMVKREPGWDFWKTG
ncbi:MAG: hypothetical protein ACLTW9_00605 [Enterocloster sp.]